MYSPFSYPHLRIHHTPSNEKGQTKATTACHICKCTDASEIITYIKVKYCGSINGFFPLGGIIDEKQLMYEEIKGVIKNIKMLTTNDSTKDVEVKTYHSQLYTTRKRECLRTDRPFAH